MRVSSDVTGTYVVSFRLSSMLSDAAWRKSLRPISRLMNMHVKTMISHSILPTMLHSLSHFYLDAALNW